MMFVLDTNVVSELRNVRLGKANTNVTAWAESVDAADLFVSAITIIKADGRFDKADLIYNPQKNEYHCLAGESLTWRFQRRERHDEPPVLELELQRLCSQGQVHAEFTASGDPLGTSGRAR